MPWWAEDKMGNDGICTERIIQEGQVWMQDLEEIGERGEKWGVKNEGKQEENEASQKQA